MKALTGIVITGFILLMLGLGHDSLKIDAIYNKLRVDTLYVHDTIDRYMIMVSKPPYDTISVGCDRRSYNLNTAKIQ